MSRSDWKRVSRRRPCPVCEKPDWCLYAGDESAPSAAICCRIESDRRAGEGGWLHRLRDDDDWRRTVHVARQVEPAQPLTGLEIAKAAELASLGTPDELLKRLAGGLGVSAESLRRLTVGWMPERRAWSFPMRDAGGRVVGVRLRLPNGRKLAIKGGREGLFYPAELTPGGRLLIAEGPSDTAALLDLGFRCIGRPSCSGGTRHLVELVKRLKPVEVAIVADGDEPGQKGAEQLASALLAYVPVVRVVVPPPGVKDARQWKQAGATAADVHLAIQAATPKTLKIQVSTNHETASLCPRA